MFTIHLIELSKKSNTSLSIVNIWTEVKNKKESCSSEDNGNTEATAWAEFTDASKINVFTWLWGETTMVFTYVVGVCKQK